MREIGVQGEAIKRLGIRPYAEPYIVHMAQASEILISAKKGKNRVSTLGGYPAESLPLFFKYLKGENGLYAGVGRPGEERGDKTLYEEMCLYSVRKK